MERFVAVAALLSVSRSANATSGSANATECRGLLSVIDINTGFSCEPTNGASLVWIIPMR
jgi:hypothetical protein